MFRFTTSRRRMATLASTAIAAGALTALPAVTGLSAASAAPVDLGYTCTMAFGAGSWPLDSTLDIDVTAPATVAPGATFDADVDIALDMGAQSMGPVSKLSGSVDVELVVGGVETVVTVPVSDATPAALHFAGTATATLTAPAAEGAADIDVDGLTGNFSAMVGTTPFPTAVPCVPDSGQEQTVTGTTVVGDDTPQGLAYDCAFQAWTFPALIDTQVTGLPASVKAGTKLNPGLTSTVTWLEEGDNLPQSSRNIAAEYADVTGSLETSAKAGAGSLAFDDSSIPADGPVVWTASGSFGAIDTAKTGTKALTLGDLTLEMQTKNQYTGVFMDATMDCTLADGQDTSLGSVKVTTGTLKVTGSAKIKGTAKVGKTLTAVPGKASGAKVSYQWLSNGKAVKKATASKLKLTKSLKGRKVSVKVTYKKAGYKTVTQTATAVKVK